MLLPDLSRATGIVPFLLATIINAQRDCQGDTSTYDQNGLIVPFKNLCGKDIQKDIDFSGATTEEKWSDCLESCVKKVPLCYGFDYTPFVGYSDGKVSRHDCWLKNATFSENDASFQNFVVDAAMLSRDYVAGLFNDCKTLGLRRCFEQNGRIGSTHPSLRMSSTAIEKSSSSSALSAPTAEPSGVAVTNGGVAELSTGAKAGIGAGSGVLTLMAIVFCIVCVLRRQKRRRNSLGLTASSDMNMLTVNGQCFDRSELPSHTDSGENKQVLAIAPADQVHEIDGSARHEK